MDESEIFERAVSSDPGLPSLRDCRDLVRSHGGQLKFTAPPDGDVRLELEVPAKPLDMTAPVTHSDSEGARAGVPLTAIVLDPNPADQRALISALYDLGHRGVPSASAEEAVELARRLHFDVLFCAASLIGTPWLECYQNARRHVRTFVLLTSGRDATLSAALEQGGPRTLAKPVRLDELSECLQDAGTPSTASRS
jgi:CheY-like chemotaxis protein